MGKHTKRISMMVVSVIVVVLMCVSTMGVNIGVMNIRPYSFDDDGERWETVKFFKLPQDVIDEDVYIRDVLVDQGIIDAEDSGKPVLELLEHLSDLERRFGFVNVDPYYRHYWWGEYGRLTLCYDAVAAPGAEGDGDGKGMTAPTVNAPEVPQSGGGERLVEEADIVKLVGDTMYVLNPYRGLQIIDLADPDRPFILGRAAVVGTPVDLYVVGSRAIVITSATMTFWSQYMRAEYNSIRGEDDVSFRLGSEIAIIDISDPNWPQVVMEFGVTGFVTDSRRVGDVLYFVSSVSSFYNHTTNNQEGDYTSVVSVNLANPYEAVLVDKVKFPGESNHIHVTKERIYVAQPGYSDEAGWGWETKITIVDISDPAGDIVLRDSYSIRGEVEERYQLDHYDGTFRVITHYWKSTGWRGVEVSQLTILDVEDPNDIRELSTMEIGDPGDLMATRFEGDRAYTIHLPRNRIDPLDVMDLSDPENPELCCILEIPGWVDHLIVRGYQILAIGVNQTWNQQVAITLFDVTDPYNAIVQDRVVLEGDSSWSQANWDPRSITVLDEEGLLLLPYSNINRNEGSYQRSYENGVYIVAFDLEAGDLDLAGSYPHTGAVTRTRQLGDRVISTSVKFLEVADVSDPYEPRVTATLELCPYVIDAVVTGDLIAELLMNHADGGVTLRVMPNGYREGEVPYATLALPHRPFRWVWNGDMLYLFDQSAWEATMYVRITTVDMSDLSNPHVADTYYFLVKAYDYYDATRTPFYNQWFYYDYYWDYHYRYTPYYTERYENLVLVDPDLMVYHNHGRLYAIDLSRPARPRIASVTALDDENGTGILHMMNAGRKVMITRGEYQDMDTHEYWVRPVKYYLQRIDLHDPFKPHHLTTVNIPGIPEGVDSTGRYLYTTGYWLFEDGSIVRSLNVARLGTWNCVILSAFDITGYDSVVVEDGKAVITEWDSESTVLLLLDLHGEDGIEQTAGIEEEGSLASPHIEGGHLFITGTDSSGMMVYSILGDHFDKVGFFRLDRTVESIQVVDGVAYVVQGMYGLSRIPLT